MLSVRNLPYYTQGYTRISRITDPYNPKKVWVIRHYKDGHYYWNQQIDYKNIYSRFTRTTAKHIDEVLFK